MLCPFCRGLHSFTTISYYLCTQFQLQNTSLAQTQPSKDTHWAQMHDLIDQTCLPRSSITNFSWDELNLEHPDLSDSRWSSQEPAYRFPICNISQMTTGPGRPKQGVLTSLDFCRTHQRWLLTLGILGYYDETRRSHPATFQCWRQPAVRWRRIRRNGYRISFDGLFFNLVTYNLAVRQMERILHSEYRNILINQLPGALEAGDIIV